MYQEALKTFVPQGEAQEMVDRHGISMIRAMQILRDRAQILRRRPIRSINMCK